MSEERPVSQDSLPPASPFKLSAAPGTVKIELLLPETTDDGGSIDEGGMALVLEEGSIDRLELTARPDGLTLASTRWSRSSSVSDENGDGFRLAATPL